MTILPTDAAVLEPSTVRSTSRALVFAENEGLEGVDSDSDCLEIRTVTSTAAALDGLDDVDCLVWDLAVLEGSVPAFFERVRTQHATLPVVMIDRERSPSVLEAAADDRWADVIGSDDGDIDGERLRFRISLLVERRRLTGLADRALVGIELAADPIAIVDPDGQFEFANRSFVALFETGSDDLVGQPWQTVFGTETVDRLEATAIPTAIDGWRWRGTCHCRQPTGETFSASVRLDGLEDGSLVFVVDPQ
ncbi:PAS domain-containing protein [Salinadaptatus halalkaliphilus]|nr:PAS domain-containing protein [Salinadaptatus halalkaliphilus]